MTHVIGTETEYGVYRPGDAWANLIALSSQAVRLYAEISRDGTPAQGAAPVRWRTRSTICAVSACHVRPPTPRC